MTLKQLLPTILLMIWIVSSSPWVYAQRLGNENKLKTAKRSRRFGHKPKTKAPSPARKAFKQTSPRYSKNTAGKGNYRRRKPKQMQPVSAAAYQQGKTRYGQSSTGQGNYPKHKIKANAPRDTRQFSGKAKPRFSKPVAYQRIKLPSQQKRRTFFGMALYKRPYSNKLNGGKGVKQRARRGLYAKQDYNNCGKMTKEKEKLHLEWVRMKDSNPIRHKTKKAKFDKDEADIWNN